MIGWHARRQRPPPLPAHARNSTPSRPISERSGRYATVIVSQSAEQSYRRSIISYICTSYFICPLGGNSGNLGEASRAGFPEYNTQKLVVYRTNHRCRNYIPSGGEEPGPVLMLPCIPEMIHHDIHNTKTQRFASPPGFPQRLPRAFVS